MRCALDCCCCCVLFAFFLRLCASTPLHHHHHHHQQQPQNQRAFGFTKKNEITNGRWVMFGFFVGMLTEYATGVDFPGQLLQTVSYLGLWDFE
jgi:hypothetical protein